jgi:DNA processing protein
LAADLARAGVTVVSGFARGVDTAAHLGALEAEGRTVAVLGSGLERVYPPENAALVSRVAERGAVVSELPLSAGPMPGHFPRRNRIIAGWGRGVVVIEAGAKSGALITASLALESGREVMAVPGHPSSPGATGTNALIRDGARLVRDACDVALELGVEFRPALAPQQASAPASSLLAALQVDRPATLEELAERSGRAVPELLAELTELELLDKVRRLPGPQFLRS